MVGARLFTRNLPQELKIQYYFHNSEFHIISVNLFMQPFNR